MLTFLSWDYFSFVFFASVQCHNISLSIEDFVVSGSRSSRKTIDVKLVLHPAEFGNK